MKLVDQLRELLNQERPEGCHIVMPEGTPPLNTRVLQMQIELEEMKETIARLERAVWPTPPVWVGPAKFGENDIGVVWGGLGETNPLVTA